MNPFFRLLLAALIGGMAAWFMRSRSDRGEPGWWFLALLLTASLSALLSAISWWIGDETISRSFWMAHWITLSLSICLVFCFTRSFNSKPDLTLLFWSLPFMLDLALIIIDGQYLFERSGNTWMPQGDNAFVYLHIGISAFYAAISLYNCVMVYNALKLHDEKEKSMRFRYILAGLLVIFAAQVVVAPLRAVTTSASPVAEGGTFIGGLLLWRGIVEPKAVFSERKRQRVA